MTVLWQIGRGTVRDLIAKLAADRNLAYTSVATIMRILEQKNFVTSVKEGKTFVYTPVLAKDAYQSRSLKDLSAKLFDDTPASLVARLVDDYTLRISTYFQNLCGRKRFVGSDMAGRLALLKSF